MPVMTNVQRHSKTRIYRYQRRIPADLREVIGKAHGKTIQQWVIESLDTKDPAEAKRRAIPVAARVEAMFEAARAGEYPLLADEAIELIAYKWIGWAEIDEPLPDEKALVASLTKYLSTHHQGTSISGRSFERLKADAIAEHEAQHGGFAAEVEERQRRRVEAMHAIRQDRPPVIAPVVNGAPTPILAPTALNLTLSELFARCRANTCTSWRNPAAWGRAARVVPVSSTTRGGSRFICPAEPGRDLEIMCICCPVL
jgi:hypothetical protein